MNAMNIPGFTAETSLYKTKTHYQSRSNQGALFSDNGGGGILPARLVPLDEPGGGGGGGGGQQDSAPTCGSCIDGWMNCGGEMFECTSCGSCETRLTGPFKKTCKTGNSTSEVSCKTCVELPLPWPAPDQTICIGAIIPEIDITVS